MRKPANRFHPLRTRLALVVVGVALGLAARWIGGMLEHQVQDPHFKPMPAEATTVIDEDGQ